MTKKEAIEKVLEDIQPIHLECDDLNGEADDIFIESLEKIREWVLSIQRGDRA